MSSKSVTFGLTFKQAMPKRRFFEAQIMWSHVFCRSSKPNIKDYIDKNGLNLTDGLVKIVEAIYDEQQNELERQNNVRLCKYWSTKKRIFTKFFNKTAGDLQLL